MRQTVLLGEALPHWVLALGLKAGSTYSRPDGRTAARAEGAQQESGLLQLQVAESS